MALFLIMATAKISTDQKNVSHATAVGKFISAPKVRLPNGQEVRSLAGFQKLNYSPNLRGGKNERMENDRYGSEGLDVMPVLQPRP